MIALYCIRRAGEPGPDAALTGVDGAAVRLIEVDFLAGWVSDSSDAPVSLDRLREHDRVVRAAMATSTPLPVRFGARFGSEAELIRELSSREAEFLSVLDRVTGRAEMGVRVAWQVEESEPGSAAEGVRPASGTQYLEMRRDGANRKAELEKRAGEMLAKVEAALGLSGVPVVRTLMPVRELAGTLAHLVQRTEVAHYRAAVAAADRSLPDLELAATGPWAPYSFVGAEGAADVRPADTR